jgi:hypothetical protein
MVAIDCDSTGLPLMDIGIPPRGDRSQADIRLTQPSHRGLTDSILVPSEP